MINLNNTFRAFWLPLALFAVLVAAPPLAARYLCYSVGDGILWATGLIILAYTAVTRRMWREMVQQNEIAIQPLLLSTIEPLSAEDQHQPQSERAFILRNIGRGPALSIRVNDIDLGINARTRQTVVIKFAERDCIPGGEKVPLDLYGYEEGSCGGGIRRMDAIDELAPRFGGKNYEVTISYKDINGQQYESRVRMGGDGVELLQYGKARAKR